MAGSAGKFAIRGMWILLIMCGVADALVHLSIDANMEQELSVPLVAAKEDAVEASFVQGLARTIARYVPEPIQQVPIVQSVLQVTRSEVDPGLSYEAEPGSKQVIVTLSPAAAIASSIIMLLLVGLVAYLYNDNKKFPPDDVPGTTLEDGVFKFHLFSCFDDANICCFTFCCAAVRWADTMRMFGFMSFFAALSVYMGCVVLSSFLAGIGILILVAICTYYRQQIRAKFGMPNGSCGSITGDCLTYCCCGCCAIIQEARQVEEAFKAKHPAVTSVV